MKQLLPFLLLTLFVHTHAQKPNLFIDSIISNRTLKIPAYKLASTGNESKVFTMQFAKSEFIDTTGIGCLNDADILSIDLVFTDYPSKLDLKPLNKSRFQALGKLLPTAMENPFTKWQVFRQMDGFDKESAKGMLHGFVINYRKKQTRSLLRKELDLIKMVTPEEIIIEPEPEPVAPPKKINHWDVIHSSERKRRLFYNDRLVKAIGPSKKEVTKDVEKKDSLFSMDVKQAKQLKFIDDRNKQTYLGKDTVYVLLYPRPEEDTIMLKRLYKPKVIYQIDSTVISIFKRNRFRNILMVVDVTGSMSPYSSQVIQWLYDEANQQNLKSIACFNDGDGKQTEAKQIGNTGGVYGDVYQNPVQVSELIQKVMMKGSGGDTPENVCEALLKAIAMFKDYEDVVLIADNWAPVRDIGLASQISKPVRVIGCGDFAPHADYVDIAFKTGGSIHLTDQDITGLSILATGKELTIRGRNYKLENGRVVAALK